MLSADERRARVYCADPGTYAVRLVKGGPEVALRVEHQPSADPWTGEINWERPYIWTYTENGRVAWCDMRTNPKLYIGRRIDEAEYRYLLADRVWAAEHATHLPEAQPSARVDLRKMQPIF